ncbi:MAG TPA: hypothetical protein VKA30_09965 [Actinomycetota bacterium]|nr:hypothetical protein [Actinomycetota bacterium]
MPALGTNPRRTVVRVVIAIALVGGAALMATPARAALLAGGPNSHIRPLLDGCQRSNAMQLTMTTPEWVYVHHAAVLAARLRGDTTAGRVTVQGVVSDIHPAGDDLFINHDYNDVDIAIALDPPYRKYSATGNGGEEIGTEWEETLVPAWAWPQVGDRVQESGSWIWDCGHWGNGEADPTRGVSQLLPYDPVETGQDLLNPGTITGEQTELHPVYELAVFRKEWADVLQGQEVGRELQRLDVWISGDGGPALSEEECALYGLPPAAHTGSILCPRYRDVGGHYSYTMHLGPAAGSLIVNPTVVHPETTTQPSNLSIQPDANAGTVTVSFDLPHGGVPQRLGLSIEAGWSEAPLAVHHTVTLDSLEINATLDGPTEPNLNPVTAVDPEVLVGSPLHEQTPNPGEWVMWTAVNGRWWQIPTSSISRVSAGKVIPLQHTIDYWLPQGVQPTLFVSGRECDIPLMDCRKDRYGAPPTAFLRPFLEVGYNDKPGRIESGNEGLPLTTGQATYEPPVSPDPFFSDETLSDAACGGPCYSFTATAD